MAASGGAWTPPILRGAHEPTGAVDLSLPSRAALASRAVATKPEWPRALGSYAAPHQPLVASAYCLSSLSPAPHGRYYLRQEPDAVVPLVRICGGGREQSRSLLRLSVSRTDSRGPIFEFLRFAIPAQGAQGSGDVFQVLRQLQVVRVQNLFVDGQGPLV